MMAVGMSVLERAKKTLVYVLRRLLTSGIDIIEEGGVGVNGTTSFVHASVIFAHPGINTFL